MIILDTNVVSEPMRPVPNPDVMAWLDGHEINDLWITAITAAELHAGVAMLEHGARRRSLATEIEATLDDFHGRVLPFAADAAFVYGELTGPLLVNKTKFGILDYQIAAIALVHGAVVATRNTKDFVATGVPLTNPWDA